VLLQLAVERGFQEEGVGCQVSGVG
jgi:hypothetical protein